MIYDVLIPTVPFIAGYLGTYTLYKGGIIKKNLHVNLWNFIIGAAFLISGIGGFILLILMAVGIKSPLNPQLLYWHVEAGLTLTLVTVFHFRDYWKSTKKLFFPKSRRIKT